jgi:hypothetical protein
MAMHENVLDCDQTTSTDAPPGDRDRLLQILEYYRIVAEKIHKPRATQRLLMTGLGFSPAESWSASERPEESVSH